MVDLDTGDVWGFPVAAPNRPYPPFRVSEGQPTNSRPVYLGRYDLAAAHRSR